ncbi:LuxR family transcriptional regulator [Pseudomonas cremoricolorata]|uniref:LuxR family transcriptional regulator n=1 Tax=Pseudomonas cremoricolorata TaxID=157783 RepID=UPI0009DC3D37|nr:LuxR family transcriptional regulator [Pseudomonas cremoricolorata]
MDSRPIMPKCDVHAPGCLHTSLQSELETQLGDLRTLHYAYFATVRNRDVQPLIISNYPARWLKSYKAANAHLIDPVIQYGLTTCAPFSWSDATAAYGDESGVDLFRRSGHHHLRSGATFTLHDASGVFSALSFSDGGGQAELDRRMADQQAQIQMALIRFHCRIMGLHSLDQLFPSAPRDTLSQRETSVLKLVMLGQNYRDIAKTCGISERTVKFHMSNITSKLQVSNARQAIYEAQCQGLL